MKDTYTLQSYSESFNSINSLVNFAIEEGICPSCEILKNGEKTGEYIQEYLRQ